jgi:hypothetical protein
MSTNWNSSTPSIPGGNTAVTFQTDAEGNFSAYVPTPATPPLSPVVETPVDLTAQDANISSTALYAVTSTGRFRVGGYIVLTTADLVSSALPSIVIGWTDADNSVTQTLALTLVNTGNTTTTYATGSEVISALTGNNITYSTTGYLSNTPSAMKYALHLTIESLTV